MAALGRSLCWFGRASQRDTPHTTFAPTVRHYPDPQQKLEGRKQQCTTKRRIGGEAQLVPFISSFNLIQQLGLRSLRLPIFPAYVEL
jgi:hypothetical protein